MEYYKQSRFRRRWNLIKSYIGWEDFIAVLLILLGAIGYFEGPIPFIPHLTDFYMDIRSDLIGIGITVLIIDNVNEIYRRRAEKERLILQMGSPDNSFAIEAARQLRFRGWLFDGSLKGASLTDANLQGAHLHNVNLQGAFLITANLRGAILPDANLERTHLLGAHMEGAHMDGSNLQKALLVEAHMEGASLVAANLQEAYLMNANLEGAHLAGANLEEAWLCLAWRANLEEAWLEKANLKDADLEMANLKDADLEMANLHGAIVTKEQLEKAKSLKGATMPDGTTYEKWLIRKEKEQEGQ